MTGGGISKNNPIWNEVESLLGVDGYAGGHYKGNEELINFGVFVLHRDRAERSGGKIEVTLKGGERGKPIPVDPPDDLGSMLERLVRNGNISMNISEDKTALLSVSIGGVITAATPREAVEAAIKEVEEEQP